MNLTANTSQEVFRAVLDAMAHPGEILKTARPDTTPAALIPVLALADLSTPVAVLAEDPAWAAMVTTTTGAPIGPLGQARLVSVLDGVESEEFRSLRVGTAVAPEQGAQVFIAVEDLTEHGDLVLRGPGVPGERKLSVSGLPTGFWAVRSDLVQGFPAGVDLVCVTPDGRLSAIPRSTSVQEVH